MPSSTEHVALSISVASGRTRQAGFGVPLFAATFAGSARQYGPYTSVAALTAASLGSSAAIAWATALCSQQPAPRRFKIGRIDASDADEAAALTAIEAAGPAAFYVLNHETRAESSINAVAAWTESRRKIYLAQNNDAAVLAGTSGNVALDLQTAAYNRTGLVYHTSDTEYLDAAVAARICAQEIDSRNGVGPMAYKSFVGPATANALTDAQADAIEAAGANWYDLIAAPSGVDLARVFYPGQMASGRRIDTQVSIDWLHARLTEALVGALIRAAAGNGSGIPFNDAGFGYLAGVALDVFNRGVDYGHFKRARSEATGRDTPWVDFVPLVDVANPEDRIMQLSAEAIFRGSVETIVPFSITLGFN